jgi:hypothetical protein
VDLAWAGIGAIMGAMSSFALRSASITFVGDVHGWDDRLARVLNQAVGHVVFVGDLVDRGPDAPGVLKRVHGLCDAGRASCILGNHEYALLRGIGIPRHGIEADPEFFAAWRHGFGGDAVMEAYRVKDAAALVAALGPLHDWLASLPWVLEGGANGRTWIAVHAGLAEDQPLAEQLELLRQGWTAPEHPPESLFSKDRQFTVPIDLPDGCTVVSGHTPVGVAFVSPQRILCDTSGGMKKRPLSAVIWPQGKVITG